MAKLTDQEMLAYARFQRAVNHLAVAQREFDDVLLSRPDGEAQAAYQRVGEAKRTVDLAVARAVAERLQVLRGEDPTPATDDQPVSEPLEPVVGPPIAHRVLQGSTSELALCGAPMSSSTPNAPACGDCNRVLEGRLGTMTHSSPTFLR